MRQRAIPTARAGLMVTGLVLVGLVGGCYQEPVAIATYPPTDRPASSESPTRLIPTAPDIDGPGGAPSADCINGWTALDADSPQLLDAIELLDNRLDIHDPWQIDDVRLFSGPDVSWSDTPVDVVTRWYLRVTLATDASFRGRFLLERRSDVVAGVAAVAPYDSTGFTSPDWTGFFGDGQPQTYPGLPGRWSGTPYDFVSGAGYSGQPGLPDQVIGCFSDT